MSIINISNLTFNYNNCFEDIFRNVSFQIDTDWKLGFTGRNGRGKTTFLNLLLKKYEYKGSITASVDFDYFPYEIKDKNVNTLNLINSICSNIDLWQIERELNLLDVFSDVLERPFVTLSNGEQTKVLLAALFLKSNNFLLIDEPTNHLDSYARKIVCNYLNNKKGFILVSHDRMFLDNCVDHILSINKENIEIQKGNFTSWWLNKEKQDAFELAENEKLKLDIKRLEEAAKRKSNWSVDAEKAKYQEAPSGFRDSGYIGHKAAKVMKSAKVIEKRQNKAIEDKSKLLKNIEAQDNLKISPLKYHKNKLIEINDLSIYYGKHLVCDNINYSISQGERVSLSGKNGSGKSSIIKLMIGDDINYHGKINISSNIVISYVPQDTSFLKGNLKDFAASNHIDESLFKSILRKMDFSRIQFEKNMEDFSGGQKKKVLIAKSLCEKAHIYIWDEPLNFIDILSRMQIEELILKYELTILFVEHDLSFNEKIATKIIDLDK